MIENKQMTIADTEAAAKYLERAASDQIYTTEEPGTPEGSGERWRVPLPNILNKIAKGSYIPIASNIPFIDDLTGGGFVPGTLTLITADPGAGKTALCQQMAAQFARNGHNVAFVNYEMDEGLLYARDLAREVKPSRNSNSGLPYDPSITAPAILRGNLAPERGKVPEEMLKRFRDAVEDYQAHIYPRLYYKPFILELDGVEPIGAPRPIRNTMEDLKILTAQLLQSYEARKKKAAEALADGSGTKRPEEIHAAILFIDYVQLIAGASDSKINNLEEITGILTEYAQEGNTIVFAISSANRSSRLAADATLKNGKKDEDDEPGPPWESSEEEPGKLVYIYIDKARLANPRKLMAVRFIGAASKFVPEGESRPRNPTAEEAKSLLSMTSAAGASVLEYSASYFLSINRTEKTGGGSGKPKDAREKAEKEGLKKLKL